jgi:hypothetical protein
MDKYLIVKVPDADATYEEPVTFMGTTKWLPHTQLGRIGSAVRIASEKHFVGASWMATHGIGMTQEESETVARIFENVYARARRANPKKYERKPRIK